MALGGKQQNHRKLKITLPRCPYAEKWAQVALASPILPTTSKWKENHVTAPTSGLHSWNLAIQRNLSLPACFGDDHLSSNVMEPLPEVSALELHLNLFHGRHGSRHRACSTRAQVRVSVKGTGSPLSEHLRVWTSALLRICKIYNQVLGEKLLSLPHPHCPVLWWLKAGKLQSTAFRVFYYFFYGLFLRFTTIF